MERARLQFLDTQKPGLTDAERNEGLQQARDLFQQAGQIFEKNRALMRARLERIPKALRADKDAEQIRERDQLRADYVEAQFLAALIRYEFAQTFPAEDPEAKQQFQRAEEAFGVVAEKYRRRVAGLSAVLFQGRCRQACGDIRARWGSSKSCSPCRMTSRACGR